MAIAQRAVLFCLIATAASPATHAQMVCLSTPDPSLATLQTLVTRDATRALEETRARIGELERAPQTDPTHLASLYALAAESSSLLELDNDARAAATRGLALAPQSESVLRLSLLTAYVENVYDVAGLQSAEEQIKTARSNQKPGSLADTCLLITLGLLQMRQNNAELAIVALNDAYRTSDARGMADQKAIAAGTLSSVLALLGDYEQALRLNQESVDWAEAHAATLSQSILRFERGKILRTMRDFSAALRQFTAARSLSVDIHDEQGIAFADQELCNIQIELAQYGSARPLCESALRAFTAANSIDVIKETRALLARIDLQEGHPKNALATLNQVLDHGGIDLYPRRVASMYQWRSQANAALGRDREAYDDLSEYLRRYMQTNDAERIRNGTGQRLRFDMAIKDQELQRVHAEALAARLEVSRQALLRNLIALSATLGLSTVLFSTWLWRRRKESESVRQVAEDRVAAIGRLTGGVAHEFNNLLTVIQQAASLLARDVGATADAAAAALVADIQRATAVCAEITAQLLSFARQQNLRPQSIQVSEFLAELRSTLATAVGPAVRVAFELEQSNLTMWADQRQLTAALLNLVINARDAMPNGGTVTLRIVATSRYVRIDVLDEGCGMNADVLAHAVDPFFSTKPMNAGSGLGLSVVDGFVRQSGGTMTISSAPNRGTTISLLFPRLAADHG